MLANVPQKKSKADRPHALKDDGVGRRPEAGVDAGERFEKHAVVGQGEEDPRAGVGVDPHRAERGQGDHDRDEDGPGRQDGLKGFGGDAGGAGDPVGGEEEEIPEVGQPVGRADDDRAQDHRPRDGPPRVARFAREIRGVLPAADREIDADEGQAERAEEAEAGVGDRDVGEGEGETGAGGRAEDEPDADDHGQAGELEDGEELRGEVGIARPDDVHGGHDGDGRGAEDEDAGVAHRDVEGHVFGEGQGEGGDARAVDHDERHPGEQEGGERAEDLLDVGVLAAGAREHRPELGERERAGERVGEPEGPDEEDPERRGQIAGDERGAEEDPGPDAGADGDHGQAEEGEVAAEGGHGGVISLGGERCQEMRILGGGRRYIVVLPRIRGTQNTGPISGSWGQCIVSPYLSIH